MRETLSNLCEIVGWAATGAALCVLSVWLLVVWLGLASAVLAAIGIAGVNGVVPDVRDAREARRMTFPPDA